MYESHKTNMSWALNIVRQELHITSNTASDPNYPQTLVTKTRDQQSADATHQLGNTTCGMRLRYAHRLDDTVSNIYRLGASCV